MGLALADGEFFTVGARLPSLVHLALQHPVCWTANKWFNTKMEGRAEIHTNYLPMGSA